VGTVVFVYDVVAALDYTAAFSYNFVVLQRLQMLLLFIG
jgi:hypothetical protein